MILKYGTVLTTDALHQLKANSVIYLQITETYGKSTLDPFYFLWGT